MGISTSECPVCQMPVWKKELGHNTRLANLVQAFKETAGPLEAALGHLGGAEKEEEAAAAPSGPPEGERQAPVGPPGEGEEGKEGEEGDRRAPAGPDADSPGPDAWTDPLDGCLDGVRALVARRYAAARRSLAPGTPRRLGLEELQAALDGAGAGCKTGCRALAGAVEGLRAARLQQGPGGASPSAGLDGPLSQVAASQDSVPMTRRGAPREYRVAFSGLEREKRRTLSIFCMNTPHSLAAESVTAGTTHLVVQGDRRIAATRTVKYLQAILLGCWVVTADWVEASVREGRWVDELPYEVVGDRITEYVGGPAKARRARLLGLDGRALFEGTTFVLHEVEHEAALEGLIRTGGGKVAGPAARADLLLHRVLLTKHSVMTEGLEVQAEARGCAVVNQRWLFDCISAFKRLPTDGAYHAVAPREPTPASRRPSSETAAREGVLPGRGRPLARLDDNRPPSEPRGKRPRTSLAALLGDP